MVQYQKSIKNLGLFRDSIISSNILNENNVEILNIVSSKTNNIDYIDITYSRNLTNDQTINMNTFITDYIDKDFENPIIPVKTTNEIKIQEEANKTNGFYCAMGVNFDAKPGKDSNGDLTVFPNITQYPFIMDIPISALNGIFKCQKEHKGDVLDSLILPQTATSVGICTQDVHDGDTILHVNSTVLAMVEIDHLARITLLEMNTYRLSDKVEVIDIDTQNSTITLKYPINFENGGTMLASNMIVVQLDTNIIGYITQPVTINNRWIHVDSNSINYLCTGRWINLFQHNQSRTQLRMIIEIDKINSKVKIREPFNVAMNPNDITTYIQLTSKMISDIELDINRNINIGIKTIGGSSLRDVVIILQYTNKGPKYNKDGELVSIKRVPCELHILY